jgi:hypothetical protein
MTRRSHRIKTHSRWRVWQIDDDGTHPIHHTRAPEHYPTLN